MEGDGGRIRLIEKKKLRNSFPQYRKKVKVVKALLVTGKRIKRG